MTIRLPLVAVGFLWVCTLGGCGAALNLSGEKRIYGGALLDAGAFTLGVCEGVGVTAEHLGVIEPQRRYPVADPLTWMWVSICAAFDLPFTLVADTATLPWTVHAALWQQVEGSEENRARADTVQHSAYPPGTLTP